MPVKKTRTVKKIEEESPFESEIFCKFIENEWKGLREQFAKKLFDVGLREIHFCTKGGLDSKMDSTVSCNLRNLIRDCERIYGKPRR